ncbi:MAG: PaaI family thioesterase [Candidatus Calescibacterium sp.]|nr:PaaI family thioesterase [Candidatus Calescibacterium sp.]MCX7734735.1 PaaI family thioesterase [bacterium]MDW8087283.1 PaaI family thioesterase [Candidatus Calescibacterium sp.]
MEQKTHNRANPKYCGRVVRLEDGEAEVELDLTEEMIVDEKGLIHGGFTFSAADYAAMVAVNHPLVVLAGAEVKFLKPTKVGETIVSKAKVVSQEGKKIKVEVSSFRKSNQEKVFEGNFTCIIPSKHVLD